MVRELFNLDPKLVNMGNVVSAGLGQNPARQAAIFGGLAPEVGRELNKVCGSGLKAVATPDRKQFYRGGRRYGIDDQRSYLLPQARSVTVFWAMPSGRIPSVERTGCGTSTTTHM